MTKIDYDKEWNYEEMEEWKLNNSSFFYDLHEMMMLTNHRDMKYSDIKIYVKEKELNFVLNDEVFTIMILDEMEEGVTNYLIESTIMDDRTEENELSEEEFEIIKDIRKRIISFKHIKLTQKMMNEIIVNNKFSHIGFDCIDEQIVLSVKISDTESIEIRDDELHQFIKDLMIGNM